MIPLDGVHCLALDARVLQQQRLDLLASTEQRLERVALETAAKAERYAFQVNATARYRLDVIVVDERDAVQVDHLGYFEYILIMILFQMSLLNMKETFRRSKKKRIYISQCFIIKVYPRTFLYRIKKLN